MRPCDSQFIVRSTSSTAVRHDCVLKFSHIVVASRNLSSFSRNIKSLTTSGWPYLQGSRPRSTRNRPTMHPKYAQIKSSVDRYIPHTCIPITHLYVCLHTYLHMCVLSLSVVVRCNVSALHPAVHGYTLNPPVFGFSGLNMLKVNEKFPESKMSILWSRYLHWECDDSLGMVNFEFSPYANSSPFCFLILCVIAPFSNSGTT